MHYTSIENIHKLIDPLFLDELREELRTIKALSVETTRRDKLVAVSREARLVNLFEPRVRIGELPRGDVYFVTTP